MDTIYTIDVIKTSFGIILNNFLEEFLWIFLCIFLWHLALTTIIGDCLQKNFKRKQSDQDGFRMFQDCESTKCVAIRRYHRGGKIPFDPNMIINYNK